MKIQLKRSNVLDGGSAKEPTSDQMEYGELAVNYNNTDPSIFLKDSNDTIVKIIGEGSLSFSGDYNDLSNQPEIGNGTITIKKGTTEVGTFTVNQTGPTEITIPEIEYWEKVDGTLQPSTPEDKLSATGGASFSQQLDEQVNIRSEAITTDSTIATLAGNVHYYTAASSGTFTPDITYTLFDTFNSNLDIGSTAAITILTNSNVNGYLTGLNIDGASQTILWSGGEAPTEGGQSGVDAYSFQIIKTADSTYTVLGSYNSFA